ncbi:UDP-N-acetylglucosamine 2-epimerase (non-hydrolyzing) [Candidatus Woesearchaeota archaeon]|nr:UDP-N-acetylglucosamine 2-epimerase (non-hydrolyzing) [Candidatus Woesearchaeota archaeon]
MKILTIVGARPQFIKSAILSLEILKHSNIQEIILHTGQHYDDNMSNIFFEELKIPKPKYNLNINGGSHGFQTGNMIIEIEKITQDEKPDAILIYGDTNSTLAGALVGAKLHVPVIHVEAGLRSFDKAMPEEINRICADNVSKFLFCPTKVAVDNLIHENITKGVFMVGDIMYDSAIYFGNNSKSKILEKNNLKSNEYILTTIHREANTISKEKLSNIINALIDSKEKIVLPLHPRTKKALEDFDLYEKAKNSLKIIDPVGYLDMLALESNAKKIITDSGGVQKEACFVKKPCITLRNSTEWIETVTAGYNILVDSDYNKILDTIKNFNPKITNYNFYGDGKACEKIVNIIQGDYNGI